MPPPELIALAQRVNPANLALGHETSVTDGATFVRDTRFPEIHDANHAVHITASTPAAIDALLARMEREYAHAPNRIFHCDFTTPTALEARLALAGYAMTSQSLVMLLEGGLRGGPPRPYDIRPVGDDGGWRAYRALQARDWDEHIARIGHDVPASVGEAMFGTHRVKSPPVRFWLAFEEGEPCGYLNSWEGIGGVGQVESLYVAPEHRHRGIATALLHHCVADARAHGAGPVVIVSDPTDTPKDMYASMGWEPACLKRQWMRPVRE
jgi:GNAT superfamily N-acetyltransferase